MSKIAAKAKFIKKTSQIKVKHSEILKTNILAGMATPSPPLGPQLGQRNINISNFIKDFNERTAHLKEGIPIPCRIKVNLDRSYELCMHKPPATYYLKQAAGIQRGKMRKVIANNLAITKQFTLMVQGYIPIQLFEPICFVSAKGLSRH